MTAKTKTPATYVDCAGMYGERGRYEHSLRDYCWTCAPFWERVPLCPVHRSKLTGSGYCRACKQHYALVDEEKEARHVSA